MANSQDLLAVAHEHYFAGDLVAAEDTCRQALEAEPSRAAAMHLMGLIRLGQGQAAEATGLLRAAVQRNPAQPDYHCHLGQAFRDQGQPTEASASFRRAVRLRPDHGDALYGLGTIALDAGDGAKAAGYFRTVLSVQPDNAAATAQLAWALHLCGEAEEAEKLCLRAVAANPKSASPLIRLAAIHRARTRLDEAQEVLERALTLDPGNGEAAESLAHVHHDRSLLLLRAGDFRRGWEEFEWRRRLPIYAKVGGGFSGPMWDGQDLGGRTIRLHCDQGLGDAIQFVRYAPMVKARSGRIVVVCHRPLKTLFETASGVDAVTTTDVPLPEADAAAPLMSLPGIFGTRLDTIPADIPYLTARPSDVTAWKRRLANMPGRKIGVVWAGNPNHAVDHERSMPVEYLRTLDAIPNATVFALQFGPAADAFAALGNSKFVDLSTELGDFMNTAAIATAMDLIITVDTSIAHLAGALGLPVWMLLPIDPDWRWLLDRDDSPWYPTMRLFRQTTGGDWSGVMERVVAALRDP